MRIIVKLIHSVARRFWGIIIKTTKAFLQRPARSIAAKVNTARTGVPEALRRHRDRATRDSSYARQMAEAITTLVSTVILTAPLASIVAVILTAWLGIDRSPTPGTAPTSRFGDVAGRDTDEESRRTSGSAMSLWDRFGSD